MAKRTKLGLELESALQEAVAYSRGKLALPARKVEPFSKQRIRDIRKKVAANLGDFEMKFGIPARTMEGWEQGRKIDMAARVLLTVLEKEPEAVERALSKAKAA